MADKNHFADKLNGKEVTILVENPTPKSHLTESF